MAAPTGRRRSVGFSYEGLTENACRPLAEYPEQPPVDLVCGIGRGVMSDPVLYPNCGHRYCRLCITDMLKTSQRCPITGCEEVIDADLLMPLDDERERIRQLVSFCKERGKGCEWQGTEEEYEKHKLVCKQNLPITCMMCGMRVPREKMTIHITVDCPRLPARCDYCDWEGLAAGLAYHHYHECTECPVEKKPTEPPSTPPDFTAPASPATAAPGAAAADSMSPSILRQPKSAWTSPKPASLTITVPGGTARELQGKIDKGKIDSGDRKGLRRRNSGELNTSRPRRGEGLALLAQAVEGGDDKSDDSLEISLPRSPKRAADMGLSMPKPTPDSPTLRIMGQSQESGPRPTPDTLSLRLFGDGPKPTPETAALRILSQPSPKGSRPLGQQSPTFCIDRNANSPESCPVFARKVLPGLLQVETPTDPAPPAAPRRSEELWRLIEQAKTTAATADPSTGELFGALATVVVEMEERIASLEEERKQLRRQLRGKGKRRGVDGIAALPPPVAAYDKECTVEATAPALPAEDYQPVLVGSPHRGRRGSGSSPRAGSPYGSSRPRY